jgi:hypothetical protein
MAKAKDRKPPQNGRAAARKPHAGSTNHLNPHFSFYQLEAGYCVSDCQADHKAALADRLQELSQLTWGEILQAPRKGFGTETIAADSIRPRVPQLITPDVRFLSMYFGKGARLVGYRDDQVFHVVWIDPHHKVYNG